MKDNPPPLRIRPSVVAARERLVVGRDLLAKQHAQGAAATRVCANLAELVDRVLVELFEEALVDLGLEQSRGGLALVPHGGYGRRELCPFSDIDLMLLHAPEVREDAESLAQRLTRDCFDAGLTLGHSVRTAAESLRLARREVAACTSLLESRFLAGNEQLSRDFVEQFRKFTSRRFRQLYAAIVAARQRERAQYGETVYLLQPNVKRSRGGLRDIQLVRWIAAIRFGTPDPNSLEVAEKIAPHDRRRLAAAAEFLLRLRNELHFHSGQARDVLGREEQVRIAAALGYSGSEELLPVENFMRDYFRHTGGVRFIAAQFVEGLRPVPTLAKLSAPFLSRDIEGDYRIGWNHIWATRRGRAKLASDLREVLRLAELAGRLERRIAPATWEAIYRAAPTYSDQITPQAAEQFMTLLASPSGLGKMLRRLHDLRVLEKFVPPLGTARCLLQFNEYHKYTVDEHCLRAVEQATEFVDDPGILGDLYRGLNRKGTLHLTLLLHDLGKGRKENHSEVGRRLAEATCQRLGLPPQETDTVSCLVHKHLLMDHLALRRDTSDARLVARFAAEVGSPEVLQMLFLLTCADWAAVGPGVLNGWKVEVLTNLYQRALRHLAENVPPDIRPGLDAQRARIRAYLASEPDAVWYDLHVDRLPGSYLLSEPPHEAATLLQELRKAERGVVARGKYLPQTNSLRLTVVVDPGHGVFYKLTGALATCGLEVLSADIHALAGETILDQFVVRDPDYPADPPAERIEAICQALTQSLAERTPPRFRARWREDWQKKAALSRLSTEVRIDNQTSERSTILDIFTFDRPGLLYTIARVLSDLRLSIQSARIGTHLDQVVDVFYVTDQAGRKVEDPSRLEAIRTALLAAIQPAEPSI